MKRANWTLAGTLLLLLTGGCGWPAPAASPSAPNPATGPETAAPTPTLTQPPSLPAHSPSPSPSPSSAPSPSRTSTDQDQITTRVRSMTLEEKVGQMILAGVEGTEVDANAKKMIAQDHVGGIILFKDNMSGGLRQSVLLLNGLKAANAGNPAPLFLSVDQEGGRVSRLPKEFEPMPANAVVGRTGDTRLAERMGALIARQLRLLGFNVDFAPVMDVNSNPENPVIGERSFGATPALVAKMGTAEMKGIREGGVIPVIKHFPGHGDTSVDSHVDLPVVRKTSAQLADLEWIPFRKAIASGADAVMAAHILFPIIDPDAPASFSKVIIGDQLRGKLGFEGVVITDDLTMGAIVKNYGIAEAAVKSVEAGSDILLAAHGYDTEHKIREAVLDAVRSGRIPVSRIDESVIRILKLKQRYALSDRAVPVPKLSDLPNAEIRRWRQEVDAASGKQAPF
ncbi:beta-N-acetylhexosaminidase [Cohnella sp. CFH 77786]|uniref:beta-N-acetylhexosaminidase n=1 Tax=Cohnella sp. CFH 77786 TaxID=2662265 RepID=UPI001C60ED89|nr:beta-N-acetylhexosaminidase [Cohnella sp. CFH 77786]MBW5444772.1 beta-N-acetylhexosaminidase [Cohnella sp. CFH 77786]